MKKIFLPLITFALVSCISDRTDENEIVTSEKSSIQEKAPINQGNGLKLLEVDPQNLCKTGNSSNLISLNPDLPFFNLDVPVNYFEGSCDNTISCIDLGHFVDRYVAYGTRYTQAFFGSNQKWNFQSYYDVRWPYTTTVDFVISDYSYSGNMFTSPMTDTALNTILQTVQTKIDEIVTQGQGHSIVAVYYATENYLCIPATQNFQFSIKYSN